MMRGSEIGSVIGLLGQEISWGVYMTELVCTELVCTELVCTELVCNDLVCTELVCTELVCTELVCTDLVCTDLEYLVCTDLVYTKLRVDAPDEGSGPNSRRLQEALRCTVLTCELMLLMLFFTVDFSVSFTRSIWRRCGV